MPVAPVTFFVDAIFEFDNKEIGVSGKTFLHCCSSFLCCCCLVNILTTDSSFSVYFFYFNRCYRTETKTKLTQLKSTDHNALCIILLKKSCYSIRKRT
mmetsp:Transcript_61928/g.74508  ORF Transcript_61928/g.74508 Transcript_61928/m.74508 type:complete len:98 (+) Transcript_61928:377-670(+)